MAMHPWAVISCVMLALSLWSMYDVVIDDPADSRLQTVDDCRESPVSCTSQSWLRQIGMEQYTSAMSKADTFSDFQKVTQMLNLLRILNIHIMDALYDNARLKPALSDPGQGIIRAPEIASLAFELPPKLESLPDDVKDALKGAALEYRETVILHQWFIDHGIQKYFKWFHLHLHASSLEDLALISPDDVQKNPVWNTQPQLQDYVLVDKLLWELRAHEQVIAKLKGPLWEKFIQTTKVHKLVLRSSWTTLVLILAAMFVYFLKMNYTSFMRHCPSASKHTILDFVTGKYLHLQHSEAVWEWDEPQVVGKTMTFRIKFYQKNGRAYAISKRDKIIIEITREGTQIPLVVEVGGRQAEHNLISVVFTVHRSGDYRIVIMIGTHHIRGSPFIKSFLPGPVDVGQTMFVNHTSTVTCMEGCDHQFLVEPRDTYGNLCVSTQSLHHGKFNITLTETCSKKCWSPTLRVVHDKPGRCIGLKMRIDQGGCYHALATYNGEKLKNGEFTVIALTKQELLSVHNAVAKKNHNLYYEARLLSPDTQHKAKKVFCYISPKPPVVTLDVTVSQPRSGDTQLTIKEFYLKIFPKRLYTFRVCPSTKFQFLGHSDQYHVPVIVIDDGCQAPVSLATKDRNIIAACFTNFLLSNIGGSETFKDKQEFFYHKIRQFHSKRCHDKLPVKVSRWNLLETSMKATKNFSTTEWCKNFEIVFQGEEGLDWGGVRREWFEVVCLQLCSLQVLVFQAWTGVESDGNGLDWGGVRREWFEVVCLQLFDGNKSDLFTRFKDDPQALPDVKLKHYEFAGKIVGKCLYESSLGRSYQRKMVKARFTRSFLAQLIGLRVNYKYFEQDDPELYTSKIKYIEENDVDDMELTFTEEEFKDGKLHKVHELIPNGAKIAVTNENKFQYLDALAQFRLMSSVRDEIDSFLRGLNLLIPDTLLSIFDENELELLMCGTGDYSIADLMKYHSVCGSTPRFQKVLEWFWTIVSGFTQEELARLLQFTTGCSQLPPGGFSELSPHFQISALPEYERLPTAHTCFNQLCLPDYESMESMHKALLTAVNEGNQGFGFI
ncbi:hypothetical protein NP493_1590g00048 [Ridgeia piscesae]|uniref:HECT-type E3 ubiquitin transferase n=1 Tax=Ridgeia piscesae TaxID=27915 RepID=A0AAD9NAR8_RIDPI|nr:hypothetical protein NP493_1590g00048 [Ridgeia piscesae]